MSIEIERDSPTWQPPTDDAEDAITEAMRDLARWLYRQLRAEYEHLTSDEAIDETLVAESVVIYGLRRILRLNPPHTPRQARAPRHRGLSHTILNASTGRARAAFPRSALRRRESGQPAEGSPAGLAREDSRRPLDLAGNGFTPRSFHSERR